MNDPLAAVVAAHQSALAAQKAMRDASVVRGEAIRAALAAGRTWREMAEALGVKTQRVIAMSKQ